MTVSLLNSCRPCRVAALLCATIVALAWPNGSAAQSGAETQVLRDSVVALAKAQVGTKYVLGGDDPNGGFDCSGLVSYVLAALNLNTPRTARQQATLGSAVIKDPSRLKPGDLLTFSSRRNGETISHIGIYIGDGQFIHASSTAGRVIASPIAHRTSALTTIWQGARRLLAFVDPEEGADWKLIPVRRPTTTAAAKPSRPVSIMPDKPAPT